MKKKVLLLTVIVLMMTIIFSLPVFADGTGKVKITNNSDSDVIAKIFSADITIEFSNQEIYNNKVYLSYHIFDEEDKEVLFECERIAVPKPQQNLSNMNIKIDLSKYTGLNGYKHLRIKFDIIDEENAFWYSTSNKVNLESTTIKYSKNFFKKLYLVPLMAVIKHPIIFVINIIFLVLFIYIVVIAPKKIFRN